MTIAHSLGNVLSDSAPSEDAENIAQQIKDQNVAPLLPEQEWCEDCSGCNDPAAEPGMPQDVVNRSVEQLTLPSDWDPGWGHGPLYDVTYLACGHTLARLAS